MAARRGEIWLGFRLVAWLVIVLVRLARWRVRTVGLEHVPRTGGAVVTWHHTSHTDFVLTAWDIYRKLHRPVRFLALRELWDSRLVGWVPRLVGAVPVDRGSDAGRDDALRDAVAALRGGSLVLVAPEGGISESFEVERMRTGAVRMAQAAGVAIIPSSSWGTHRLSTTGRRLSLRRVYGAPVNVRFGEPLIVGPDDDVVVVTDDLRRRTAVLADALQRSYPDGTPAGAWWVPQRLGGSAPPPRHPTVAPPAPQGATAGGHDQEPHVRDAS